MLLSRLRRFVLALVLTATVVVSTSCDISQQQLFRLPEAARTALLAYTGDDIQVNVLGVGQFALPDALTLSPPPDEAWCAVYKWTPGPGKTIETEGVLLFRYGDAWTASPWVDFIDNCTIPYWGAPYWSQR